MADTADTSVRLSGDPKSFVQEAIDGGTHESAQDCVQAPVRRERRAAEDRAMQDLKNAFAAPDEDFKPLTAAEVIGRDRDR